MISIIIPVYKSENTIKRCIQSLCEQTYKDLEIIIIVDGSVDNSGKIADAYAKQDARIQVIHQINQGVSAARNAGIKAASGRYIQFVDSDDYLVKDACEKLLYAIERWNADMVVGGFHHHYFGKSICKLPDFQGCYRCKESEKEFLNLYEHQFLNMPWNKMYRLEFVKNGFPQDKNLGEDLLFNIAYMAQIESFCVIQSPIYHYIQDNSGTTLSTKRRNDRIETAFLLYHAVSDFCRTMWSNVGIERAFCQTVLKSKVAVEFIDALESLAFEPQMKKSEKMKVIKQFYKAWEKMPKEGQVNLTLLDYKIIFYFFKRSYFLGTYIMIVLRGIVVKFIRRISCAH